MAAGAAITLVSALYASLLPPHLLQEGDVLNYHTTLPRQHLLHNSFRHIPWSTADLFLLPIDFSLAPFWFVTALPNKIPQFFFLIGLLAVCARLARRFSKGAIWPSVLMMGAVAGTHAIGIQAGTGMLDILIAYLFLAALDSFLNKRIALGAIELSFYVWSKPLISVQALVTLVLFGSAWAFVWLCGIRKGVEIVPGEKVSEFAPGTWARIRRGTSLFLLVSVLVAGPFIAKSLLYSGTPLFPLGAGQFKQWSVPYSLPMWAEVELKASQLLAAGKQYGSGRGPVEFLKHLWLIAVPESGVNNRYDYPLGLMYLLFAGPFLYLIVSSARRKSIPLLPLWVVVSWFVWWMGTQQTRFLYVPLVLMYLVTVVSMKFPPRIFLGAMALSILVVSASVHRAHKQDLGRWGESVLRQKDRDLLQMCEGRQRINAPFLDVAYASCIVENVESRDPVFVLRPESSEKR